MIHRIGVLTLCLVVAAVTERATAQTSTQMSAQTSTSASARALSQDGWYLRTNLGFAVAPGLTVNARDNDWGTRCDKLSNPGLAETRPDECASAPPPAEWTTRSRRRRWRAERAGPGIHLEQPAVRG